MFQSGFHGGWGKDPGGFSGGRQGGPDEPPEPSMNRWDKEEAGVEDL